MHTGATTERRHLLPSASHTLSRFHCEYLVKLLEEIGCRKRGWWILQVKTLPLADGFNPIDFDPLVFVVTHADVNVTGIRRRGNTAGTQIQLKSGRSPSAQLQKEAALFAAFRKICNEWNLHDGREPFTRRGLLILGFKHVVDHCGDV